MNYVFCISFTYTIVSHIFWVSKFSSSRRLYVKLWLKLYKDLLSKMFFISSTTQDTTHVLKILHLDTIVVKQLFIYKAHSRTPLTEISIKMSFSGKLSIFSCTDAFLRVAPRKTIQRFKLLQHDLLVLEREWDRTSTRELHFVSLTKHALTTTCCNIS